MPFGAVHLSWTFTSDTDVQQGVHLRPEGQSLSQSCATHRPLAGWSVPGTARSVAFHLRGRRAGIPSPFGVVRQHGSTPSSGRVGVTGLRCLQCDGCAAAAAAPCFWHWSAVASMLAVACRSDSTCGTSVRSVFRGHHSPTMTKLVHVMPAHVASWRFPVSSGQATSGPELSLKCRYSAVAWPAPLALNWLMAPWCPSDPTG